MPCVFRILGPLDVLVDDEYASPGGRVTRAVLSVLLLNLNHAVSTDRLLYDVWEDDTDIDLHALHSHVTRLRSLLGADRIIRSNGSYELRAEPTEIDAFVFEQLVQEAIRCPDAAEARHLCLAALDLWRGVPFGDLADHDFTHLEIIRLEEIRLNAIQRAFRADLELGRHQEVIGSLKVAVAEFPYNEAICGFYMTALSRLGRRPEAIQAYEELATTLSRDLGIEPSVELQELRKSICGQ